MEHEPERTYGARRGLGIARQAREHEVRLRACSVALVSKPALPNRLLNLEKRGFLKLDPCILAGSGFETRAAERALKDSMST